MKKVLVSLAVHEKPDVIKDQIKNFKFFLKNVVFILHVSKSYFDKYNIEELKGIEDVYINPENLITKWGNIVSTHISNYNYAKKNIKFTNENKISLVSVFFHSLITPEENFLFIGHVGVLVPTSDGKLMFIEKLAFQEPFQAIKFDNRSQLNDYLMNKYDVEFDQPNARPFIMENDELLKEYRANPNNGN